MPKDLQVVALTDLAREMQARGVTVSYHKLWCLASAGKIPAQRMGNRWIILSEDLDTIAATLTPAEG